MINHTILMIQFTKSFFIQFFSIFFPSLLTSSASTGFLAFSPFIFPIFGQKSPLMFPIFPKSCLVFPFLLFSSMVKHCSLKKAFLSLPASLWNSVFNWMYFSLSPLLFASLCSSEIRRQFLLDRKVMTNLGSVLKSRDITLPT